MRKKPAKKSPQDIFALETKAYRSLQQELIKGGVSRLIPNLSDYFVLIKGASVIGIYPSLEAAYTAGLQQLGNVPMFIRDLTCEPC